MGSTPSYDWRGRPILGEEDYTFCDGCGAGWVIEPDDEDIILEPWPHIECPDCGSWIPVF